MRRRYLLLSTLAPLVPASGAAPLEVRMVARRFQFEPAIVRARLGQAVLIRLTSPEVPMGFNLPDYGVRADIVPGREAQVRFTATRAGSFTFLCDVFCGNGHEQMSGTLEVAA